MKSISVIKENTGVLSRKKLEQTGYGMLCQAFALQILNGMSVTKGLYQQLALEFPEEPEPAAPSENLYQISLNLVLETLRKLEPSDAAERVRTERLLERLGKKAELRSAATAQERPARPPIQSTAITQNHFLFQTLLWLLKTEKNAGKQSAFAGTLLGARSAARAAARKSDSRQTDVLVLGHGGALTGPGCNAKEGF